MLWVDLKSPVGCIPVKSEHVAPWAKVGQLFCTCEQGMDAVALVAHMSAQAADH